MDARTAEDSSRSNVLLCNEIYVGVGPMPIAVLVYSSTLLNFFRMFSDLVDCINFVPELFCCIETILLKCYWNEV